MQFRRWCPHNSPSQVPVGTLREDAVTNHERTIFFISAQYTLYSMTLSAQRQVMHGAGEQHMFRVQV